MTAIRSAAYGGRRNLFRLFSFLALLLLSSVAVIPLFPVLVVRDSTSNAVLFSHRIAHDGSFGIRWTHSIHRSDVEEHYRLEAGQIVLTRLRFHDYGIGMENELAAGEELVLADGQFEVRNMHRVFPALHLFIGQVRANHTLLFAGQELPLRTIGKPGEAVVIQAEKRSMLSELGGYE
ncbi:DUF1850 domain-containing protein [Brevibacillus gelatini]|uniref:DUF1850 domain-containing protein n=1 Tax=Brevibacillus gelatini TaxID=1655277 RepID=A0A3M8BA38_9BACL|nr:DUF1850 domain-containing protein [Brevibacillus gelatini]RNB60296.1 DUF1850 domain-containing protein [Brevibacillus gelatini]